MNPYNTHQQFLKHYIEKIKDQHQYDSDPREITVLELGCGDGSTPLLVDSLRGTNIRLISVDNDESWITRMKMKTNDEGIKHDYIHVKDKDKDKDKRDNNDEGWDNVLRTLSEDRTYSLVFIDSSPWESRVMALKLFKDISDYIIIHDVDYFVTNNIFGTMKNDELDYSDVFKKWRVYYPPKPWPYFTGPPTLVGTMGDFEIDRL